MGFFAVRFCVLYPLIVVFFCLLYNGGDGSQENVVVWPTVYIVYIIQFYTGELWRPGH